MPCLLVVDAWFRRGRVFRDLHDQTDRLTEVNAPRRSEPVGTAAAARARSRRPEHRSGHRRSRPRVGTRPSSGRSRLSKTESSWPSPQAEYFRVRVPIVDQKPGGSCQPRGTAAGHRAGDGAVLFGVPPVLDPQRAPGRPRGRRRRCRRRRTCGAQRPAGWSPPGRRRSRPAVRTVPPPPPQDALPRRPTTSSTRTRPPSPSSSAYPPSATFDPGQRHAENRVSTPAAVSQRWISRPASVPSRFACGTSSSLIEHHLGAGQGQAGRRLAADETGADHRDSGIRARGESRGGDGRWLRSRT